MCGIIREFVGAKTEDEKRIFGNIAQSNWGTAMHTVTVEEAQTHLVALIAGLAPGEEVLITQQDRTVARIIAESATGRPARQPGSARGKLIVLEEDDEHLDDFEGYMS